MPDAAYLAEKARRCRELANRARVAEIADQLRLWADEFETFAEAVESGEPVTGLRDRHLAGD